MGNKIDKSFIEAQQRLADIKLGNKDGKLKKDEQRAISLFQDNIVKAYENKEINSETFNNAMGLYKTNPIKNESVETETIKFEAKDIPTEKAPVEKKETRAERKEQKEYRNDIKKSIKKAVGNTVKVGEFNEYQTTTLSNLVEGLRKENTKDYHNDAIKDVEDVVKLIQATNFDSKKDVNKIKQEIKKGLNDFQLSILDDLIKLAKEEQIQKETNQLITLYDAERKAQEGKKENFSSYLKEVKSDMKENQYEGSYYNKAFKSLTEHAKIQTAHLQDNKRKAMIDKKSENVKAKQVKNELLEGAEKDDKITKQTIRNDKAGNKLTARWLDIDRTAEDLEKITTEELKKALGKDILRKLGRSYLDLKADSHNVRTLSEALCEAIGYDKWMNRDTKELIKEMDVARDELKLLTGQDFSDSGIKKIMKLCHVKLEPKDRNPLRALANAISPAFGGAVAGFVSKNVLDVTQRVVLNLDEKTAQKVLEGFGGAQGVTQVKNSDGSITITVLQEVFKNEKALAALSGAGIGIATGVIMSLIFGMENDEKACFNIGKHNMKESRYTNINEYKTYINETIGSKNPQKAELIIKLAEIYKEKYPDGDDWAKEYQHDLQKFSGNGILNCLEFRGGRLVTAKPEPKETKKEEVKAYVADKPAVEADGYNKPVMEEVKTFDASYSTWELITEMYPCLKEKYKNLNDRIRILKLAQAINNGDYSAENLDRLLILSKITDPKVRRAKMEEKGGIDYDAYMSVLKAGTIGKIKDLEELAGCKKCKDRPDRAKNVTLGGTGVGRYAADLVQVGTEWVQTKAAQDAVYALKVDGELKTFNSKKTRDDAFDEYKNNNKAKNVEKIEISYEEIVK